MSADTASEWEILMGFTGVMSSYSAVTVLIISPSVKISFRAKLSSTSAAHWRASVLDIGHGKSLPSNAGLMVGKRVLQGEAWSDLSDSRGTHDFGDKLGDK
ncbi:hypothetical protein AVEN_90321-1 [Araneus ventricosus]|uniref:Uncharacterized protein n=1 Tax=Araneus ventricosus TaxID=182803 RepID=A0A4Y2UBV1_ARAVE|nr:hypothetical protein AVEN_90321-1 [Araneus ventricosus]